MGRHKAQIPTMSDDFKSPSLDTLFAQADGALDPTTGAVVPSIPFATTFARDEHYDLTSPDHSYARDQNDLFRLAERILTRAEGGAEGLLFPSGMAAIAALIRGVPNGGRIILQSGIYWGATKFIRDFCARRDVALTEVDCSNLSQLENAVQSRSVDLVWIETPSNPYLKVTDIAGLIRGASEGAGLGNAFLSHIAAVDGIFHLVRAFDDDDIVHVDDSVDPIRDLDTIQGELCAKDRETMSKTEEREKDRIRKEKGMSRQAEVKFSDTFLSAFEKVNKLLEANTPVQTGDFTNGEVELIKDWGLITTKPQIYVVNLSKKNFIRKASKWLPKIKEWVDTHGGGQVIPMSCEFEQEYWDLKDDPSAQKGELYFEWINWQKNLEIVASPLAQTHIPHLF